MNTTQKQLFNDLKRLQLPTPPPQAEQTQTTTTIVKRQLPQTQQPQTQQPQQKPKQPGFTYTENKRNAILSWALLLMIPVFLMSIDKYEADLFNIAFVAIYISVMGYVNPGMFRINPLILIVSGMVSWFIFKYFVVGVAKHKADRKKLTNTNRILFVIMMMIIMTATMTVLPHKSVFV